MENGQLTGQKFERLPQCKDVGSRFSAFAFAPHFVMEVFRD